MGNALSCELSTRFRVSSTQSAIDRISLTRLTDHFAAVPKIADTHPISSEARPPSKRSRYIMGWYPSCICPSAMRPWGNGCAREEKILSGPFASSRYFSSAAGLQKPVRTTQAPSPHAWGGQTCYFHFVDHLSRTSVRGMKSTSSRSNIFANILPGFATYGVLFDTALFGVTRYLCDSTTSRNCKGCAGRPLLYNSVKSDYKVPISSHKQKKESRGTRKGVICLLSTNLQIGCSISSATKTPWRWMPLFLPTSLSGGMRAQNHSSKLFKTSDLRKKTLK